MILYNQTYFKDTAAIVLKDPAIPLLPQMAILSIILMPMAVMDMLVLQHLVRQEIH